MKQKPSSQTITAKSIVHQITPQTWMGIGIYTILLIGLFNASYQHLVKLWMRDEYNYCLLIPFIAAYIIYDKRSSFSSVCAQSSWSGFIPLLFGIGLYWLGELGGELYIILVASWLLFFGILGIHLGWRKLKIILFPLCLTLAMFPFPDFIYNRASLKLKLISSKIGVKLVQLVGLPAYQEGNIIDIGYIQLQVVDACSGIRSLIALIISGILVAYLFKSVYWKKVVLVLIVPPLAIALNSFRIAITGVLYAYWRPVFAQGFFHTFSGWLMFFVASAMLVTLMYLLSIIPPLKGVSNSAPPSPGKIIPPKPNVRKRTNPSPPVTTCQQETVSIHLFSVHFICAFFLLGSTFYFLYDTEFHEIPPTKRPFSDFPQEMGEWRGSPVGLEEKFIKNLQFSDYLYSDYANTQAEQINLYIAYYESQRKGASIHPPSTCFTGGGWVFDEAGRTKVSLEDPPPAYLEVNRAVIQKDGIRMIAYYWFPQRGKNITNAYLLKYHTFRDALTKKRTDGALVRVVTPVEQTEKLADAEERLQAFTSTISGRLSEFIPE